ncbi:MAG: alpha-amylase family glycosyl hydrolase [Pyrinomonadaceae bacterium]
MFAAVRIFILIVITALSVVASSAQNSPSVEKIEPPNWWANQTINPVRLLIRGKNFQNAQVASANKSLKVSNVRVNSRADYLFFDVSVAPGAKVGKYEFEVSAPGGKTQIPFEISAPLDAKTHFQGVTNDDVIYLIMTDRFSDGDVSNDNPPNAPASANDRSNPRAWHGGDFRGVINHLDYLKDLGVTAIWLTPWYDNSDDVTTCDKPWCPNTSYHGYGAIDYYGVENHFGTFADLRELIEKAHAKGIKIIQDQVANHVSIKHPWAKNPPLDDWFSPFVQNTFNNSVLLSPNASEAERNNLLHGWFDFSLPDMNQDEPEAARYEIQNALWWIAATGIDGIRQDTIQYMPRKFIRALSSAILKQYPKFYMVGEVFVRDSAQTAFFQGGKTGWDGVDTKLPSDFDFNLWQTSLDVFTEKKPARALRDVLKYDGLYPNINNITTFQNNHDTKRFMSLDGATLDGAMLHTAFLLSARGTPQLYYGEELAMTGGDDPFNRADFPGGWQSDKVDKFTKTGRTADEQKMFEWTKQWIKLRKENRALKEGKTVDLFYDDDAYVFERYSNGFADGDVIHSDEQFVVGINNSEQKKKVTISPQINRQGFGLCFKDGIGLEDIYSQIEFAEKVVKLKVNQTDCFNTKLDKFNFVIPAKSVIAFSIYRFP